MDQEFHGNEIYQNKEILEMPFDHLQYFNQNFLQEQPPQRITQNTTQQLYYEQKKELKYKNLPKLIGNKFSKWVNQQMQEGKMNNVPLVIEKLIQTKVKGKQQNFKITDLSQICKDEESQKIFQEFILNELYLDIIHSNKIKNPYLYIPGISNYYSAAEEPEKMKSNYLTRNNYTDDPFQ